MKTTSRCLHVLRVCACVIFTAVSFVTPAQTVEVKDSIRIYFEGGIGSYDPTLRNNRAVLEGYIDRIKTLSSEGRLNDITVEGYVSPDGTDAYNKRLAVERSRVLADLIEREAGIDPSKIHTVPVGINWGELRRMIEARPDVPSREALLNIIDNTPIVVRDRRGAIIGGRKKSMMDLRGGRPYRWIYANLFPEMRNAVAITLSYEPIPMIISASEPTGSDADGKLAIADSVGSAQADSVAFAPDTLFVAQQPTPIVPPPEADTRFTPELDPLHLLALKTNLLYYPILLPNLELEWYVNDRWSVTLEGNLAWWGRYEHNHSYRLLVVSPEVRRWFLRGPLRKGLFVGATVGAGLYDFENSKRGYRGEGLMAGLTCGYQWPVTRTLSLEAELGAGYVYTKYKKYMPYEGHHVYIHTKRLNYFGPIKLEFSLVWRFLDQNRKAAKATIPTAGRAAEL